MRERHSACFGLILLFVLLAISTAAPAQQAAERPLSREQKEMLAQFLRAAFPAYTKLDEYEDSSFTARPKEKAPAARLPSQQIPEWIWEYAQREKGTPKFDAISRWAQLDISIAVGLPPPNPLTDEERALYTKAYSVFTKMRQNIEAATGRKLHLFSPEQEQQGAQAKIRLVVPSTEFPAYNRFKRFGVQKATNLMPSPIEHDRPGYSLGYVERFMWDAVRFTPRARAQVDGYFVTDKDNNIELAVCYLWPQHEERLLQTLVAECLLRAMGLPEMTVKDKKSLLGHWNAAHDPHSKRLLLDGVLVNRYSDDPDHIETEETLNPTRENLPFGERGAKNLPPLSMSVHDKTMLRILYCPHLKSGMGRYETIETLMRYKDDCLGRSE